MTRLSILFRWIIYRQRKRRKEHHAFWTEKIRHIKEVRDRIIAKRLAK
jgi:hypothetical protein